MRHIQPSKNDTQFPRRAVDSILCRKRDLVIRIADWSKDKHAPYWDVEVYIGGVYDWQESKSCETKAEAVEFAQEQIKKLL